MTDASPAMFSNRTGWEIKPNRLALALEAASKKSSGILDLTESNPTHCGFKFYDHFPLSSLANPENKQYRPSPQGLEKARDAIVRYYQEKGAKISRQQILLTSSTSEAYAFLFRLLANPGDTILAPSPSYPLFDFLAGLNDVKLDAYPLFYDDGWHLSLENTTRPENEKPKALIVVHPNNPTGSFLKKRELHSLNQWAQKNKAALISDEVFLDYAFENNPERVPTLAANKKCLSFAMGGISKSMGLPQMKLGWIAVNGPQSLMAAALSRLEIIADTYLSVNTPVQNALPGWLALGKKIRAEIMARVLENKNFLALQIKKNPSCEMLCQEGGWYAILRIPGTRSEEEWVLELLRKDKVHVHPGYFFNFDREAYLVLSLLPRPSVFHEGVRKILGTISGGGGGGKKKQVSSRRKNAARAAR